MKKTRHVLAQVEKRSAPRDADTWLSDYDEEPSVDWTYYLGEREEPVTWRIMDKVKDRQHRSKGTYEALTEAMKRTRIEVTLKRPELDVINLVELPALIGFKFSSLQQRYFRFCLPTVKSEERGGLPDRKVVERSRERARMQKFLKSGMVGLRAMDEARQVQREEWRSPLRKWARLHKRNLLVRSRAGTGITGTHVSYAPLMKKVETALRHLEERWKG